MTVKAVGARDATGRGAVVTFELAGDIALAMIDNPPVNALSHDVRSGLIAALDRFEANDDAKALVILCKGATFIAGADIHEFDQPIREPRLGELIDRLDRCAKPVVAAIHGTALGGGLEVALACGSRVATAGARMGLPEVKLGLLPGSGGTVRLPRLVGVETALRLISEGERLGAGDALAHGLIDEILPEGDLRGEAVAAAGRIVASRRFRRSSELDIPAFDPGVFDTVRAELTRKKRGFAAPLAAVDLVRMAATTPFAEAAAKEYAICKEMIASPQSRALRHLFAAERRAMKVDGAPVETSSRDIRTIAVIGPGVMGRGITASCLAAGYCVILVGRRAESLDTARVAIRKMLEGAVSRGAMTSTQLDEATMRLSTTTDYAQLGDVDLAIESVSEAMDAKRDVFAQLSRTLPRRAIMATNTSFLDIELLADATDRPQNVAGMHFFNPANVMKLLENVRAIRTAPDVLVTLMSIGKRLGKTSVLVGGREGFVANRMLSKRSREAQFLLEDGATPQQIDKVLSGFGFPIGPFALSDLAGMDVMAAARAARYSRMSPREQACNIIDKLVAAGRLGQKNGAGYFRYDEKRRPQHDPAVDALLAAHRAERGLTRREIGDDEILERCLYAMINEAARILEEGVAARPGDIDVIWTSGFGWPAYLGGPMFYADQIGLARIAQSLENYSAIVGPEYFEPASLIRRLAAEGRGFYG